MIAFLTAAIAALSLSASAPPEDLGPALGASLPHSLALNDQTGAERGFDDLAGEQGLLLVFSRSMRWCPFCQSQAIDLNAHLEAFESRGYELALLTYDSVDELNAFAAKNAIAYDFLSDPDSEAIEAFGLRNPEYEGHPFADGVPYPVIFVVGPDRTIQAKLYEDDYKDRPAVELILAAMDAVQSGD